MNKSVNCPRQKRGMNCSLPTVDLNRHDVTMSKCVVGNRIA